MNKYPNLKFFAKNFNGDFIYPYSDDTNLFLILSGNNNNTDLVTVNMFRNMSQVSSSNYSAEIHINVNKDTQLNYINIGSGGGGGSGGFYYVKDPTNPPSNFTCGSGGGGGSGGSIDNCSQKYTLKKNIENIGYYLLNNSNGGISLPTGLTVNSDGNNGEFYTPVYNQFILTTNSLNNFLTSNVGCGLGGIGGSYDGIPVSNVYNIDNSSYGGGSSNGTHFNGNTVFYDGYNTSNVIGSNPTLITISTSPISYTINVCAGGSGGSSCCGFMNTTGGNYNTSKVNNSFLYNYEHTNNSRTYPDFQTFGNSSITSFGSFGGGGLTLGIYDNITYPIPQSNGKYFTGFKGYGGTSGFISGQYQPPIAYNGKTPSLNVLGKLDIISQICDGCGSGGGGGSGQIIDDTGFTTGQMVGSNAGTGLPGVLILIIPLDSIS